MELCLFPCGEPAHALSDLDKYVLGEPKRVARFLTQLIDAKRPKASGIVQLHTGERLSANLWSRQHATINPAPRQAVIR